jgi:hypothetical protein
MYLCTCLFLPLLEVEITQLYLLLEPYSLPHQDPTLPAPPLTGLRAQFTRAVLLVSQL